jgi:hypothetical protein
MSSLTNTDFTNYASSLATSKVCGVYVGSYAASSYDAVLGGYLYRKTFTHNLTRPAFGYGLFSTDGVTYYPSGDYSNGIGIVYTDSNTFSIVSLKNTGTIYYKIILNWIDKYDGTNPLITPVLQTTNKTPYFNTVNNYQKIYRIQNVQLTNPGTGNTGTYTFTHNLGYYPNYQVFFNAFSGQVWQENSGGTQNLWLYDYGLQYEIRSNTTTSAINLYYDGGSSSPATFNAWIIIYYDHAQL